MVQSKSVLIANKTNKLKKAKKSKPMRKLLKRIGSKK